MIDSHPRIRCMPWLQLALTPKIMSPYIHMIFYASYHLILENYYSIFYK